VRVGILGASGYTGAELLRLLTSHPHTEIAFLSAERSAGKAFAEVYPQFSHMPHLPKLVKTEEVKYDDVDVVFTCLPHATAHKVVASVPASAKVVDLSADFRLADIKVYEEWYNVEHGAPELQPEAVYGLTELFRDKVAKARIIANPGCYPTAAQLPLIPLLRAKLISTQGIIIDAKSGVSGAGRAAKENTLYCEVTEGLAAYGIAAHRHSPEIEQGLSLAAGEDVLCTFTPHLTPASRGIEETIYVQTPDGVGAAELKAELVKAYGEEEFVTVLEGKAIPATRHVRGSNLCTINVFDDRVPGRCIIVSCIDNLVKGASGQALQNMNVALGLPEHLGLRMAPIFP